MAALEALCRACLEREGKISLFTKVNNVTMAQRMSECVSLKTEQICSPPLPDKLCEKCAAMLQDYQSFRLMCWSCDARIRSWTTIPGERTDAGSIGITEDATKRKTRISAESYNKKTQISKPNSIAKSERNKKKISGSQSDGWDEMEVPLNTLAKIQKEHNDVEYFVENSKEDKKEKKMKTKDNTKKKKIKKVSNKDSTEDYILTEHLLEKSEGKELEIPKRDKEIKELYFPDEVPFTVTRKQKKKRRLTRYMCETCGYRANDAHSLRVHARFHTGERPHACTLCAKRFVVAVALKAHMQRHSGRPACVCERCGRGLSSAAGLRAHRRAHDAPRAHACALCPRRFTLRANLNAHQRTHTGQRPHHCEFPGCGKAFSTSSDLKGHRRVHSGERPFACPSCPKRFSLRSNLLVHQRTHSGRKDFLCPECGKAFLHKSSLKSHARVHSGVRDHACPACDARFTHSNSLRAHMLQHNDTRPRECPVCHKRFTRQATLNAHVKRHKSDVVQPPNNNTATTSAASNGDTNQYIQQTGNTGLPTSSVIEKQTGNNITRIVHSTIQDFPIIADRNTHVLQTQNKNSVVNLCVANTRESIHKSGERTSLSSFEIVSAFCSNIKSVQNMQKNIVYKSNVNDSNNALRNNSCFDATFQQPCIGQSKTALTNEIFPVNSLALKMQQISNDIEVSRNDNNGDLIIDNAIVSNDSRRDLNVIVRANDNLRDSFGPTARNDTERGPNAHLRRTMPISKDNDLNLTVEHSKFPITSSSYRFENCRGGSRIFGLSDINNVGEKVSNDNRVTLNNSESDTTRTQEAHHPSERVQNRSQGAHNPTTEIAQNYTQGARDSAERVQNPTQGANIPTNRTQIYTQESHTIERAQNHTERAHNAAERTQDHTQGAHNATETAQNLTHRPRMESFRVLHNCTTDNANAVTSYIDLTPDSNSNNTNSITITEEAARVISDVLRISNGADLNATINSRYFSELGELRDDSLRMLDLNNPEQIRRRISLMSDATQIPATSILQSSNVAHDGQSLRAMAVPVCALAGSNASYVLYRDPDSSHYMLRRT